MTREDTARPDWIISLMLKRTVNKSGMEALLSVFCKNPREEHRLRVEDRHIWATRGIYDTADHLTLLRLFILKYLKMLVIESHGIGRDRLYTLVYLQKK